MKRTLSIVLSVILTAALLSGLMCASAEYQMSKDRVYEETDSEVLNIVIDGGTGKYEAKAGETVDVKVQLVGNTGISSLKAVISWPEELTLVSAVYDIYDETDTSAMINEPEGEWSEVKGKFVFNWLSAAKTLEGDMTFVTLTFSVPEDAENGIFLPVTAVIKPYNVFAGLNTEVAYKLINGGVDVKNYELGDVNGDGKVNNKDVVALFKFLNNVYTEDDVIVDACDFNCDGKINNKDVVALFRYVSSV